MKKLFAAMFAAAVFAGCATSPVQRDEYDIKPAESDGKVPTSVEWENANDDKLKAATAPAALMRYLKSQTAADALLAEVKGAYKTDPMTAVRIHALSQLVMTPGCKGFKGRSQAECRDLWTAALLRAAVASSDPYRTVFLLDQLRWCGKSSQATEVKMIGIASEDREVKDFAALVARELEGASLLR